jgi:hypothetical protein
LKVLDEFSKPLFHRWKDRAVKEHDIRIQMVFKRENTLSGGLLDVVVEFSHRAV